MKKTFTYFLGGALFALFLLMPSTASATITAKWDWKGNAPDGIRNEDQVYRNFRLIQSDYPGIYMLVDATKDGVAQLRPGSSNDYAQFNAATKLRIPVVSTSDVVTTIMHPSSYNGIIIGDTEFDNTNTERSYTAKPADVAKGYVEVESKGSYIYSVQVELAYMPPAITMVQWDFKNNIPSGIRDIDVTSATTIESNVPYIPMTFITGRLKFNSGDNGWFQSGTKLRVPVTSTSDVVKVYMYQAYSTTIGAGETSYSIQTPNYQATPTDVNNGYVEIVFNDNGYIYAILLTKGNLTTTSIGSTGWATFSTTYATDFTNLADVVDAYQVTGFTGTAINKSSVTTVAAEKGLLLNAAAGTYAIPLTDSGDALSGNQLVAQTAAGTVTAAGTGYRNYVLVAPSGTVAFKSVTGTNTASIGAGKAYLHLDISGGAPSANFLYFDDETTGVNKVKDQVKEARGDFFDLQGRKVAQPTKGLYIVNGKKVVIK